MFCATELPVDFPQIYRRSRALAMNLNVINLKCDVVSMCLTICRM